MQCEEDAEPVSTPSSRRSQRFFQKNSPRTLRALRFDRLSDLRRLASVLDLRMKCEEDAEPVSTPSSRRTPRFFEKNSPRALRALRFDRLSDLCRLAASRPQNAVRGGRRAGFNAELAEIAEILPEEFHTCSAF